MQQSHFNVHTSPGRCPVACVPSAPSKVAALSSDEVLRRYAEQDELVTADQLASLLSERVDQAVSLVARWIVGRRVVSLSLNGYLQLPLFQFHRETLAPRPEMIAILDVLSAQLDEEAVAAWFVTPNPELEGHWPLRLLLRDSLAVLRAARTG